MKASSGIIPASLLVLTLAITGVAIAADAPAKEAVAAVAAIDASAVPAPPQPSFIERLWWFLGLLHPIVVHFPVALLMLAGMIEAARFKFKTISPDVSYYCLLVGAAGAIPAVIFGWSRASGFDDSETLFFHRWLGISLTVLTLVTAVIATLARRHPGVVMLRRVQLVGIFAAAGLVGLVGHLGGDLTYGEGHVENALAHVFNPPKPVVAVNAPKITTVEEVTPPTKGAEPTTVAGTTPPVKPILGGGDPNAVEAHKVDFTTQIWPILSNKCVTCHGPRKVKAGLRLDSEEMALKGGRSGQPTYIKGNSKASLILKLIVTNDEDEKMPPPGEGKVVTREEHDLLAAWIDQGAEWNLLPGTESAAK